MLLSQNSKSTSKTTNNLEKNKLYEQIINQNISKNNQINDYKDKDKETLSRHSSAKNCNLKSGNSIPNNPFLRTNLLAINSSNNTSKSKEKIMFYLLYH